MMAFVRPWTWTRRERRDSILNFTLNVIFLSNLGLDVTWAIFEYDPLMPPKWIHVNLGLSSHWEWRWTFFLGWKKTFQAGIRSITRRELVKRVSGCAMLTPLWCKNICKIENFNRKNALKTIWRYLIAIFHWHFHRNCKKVIQILIDMDPCFIWEEFWWSRTKY